MDLRFTPAQEAFRADARAWLESRLGGRFAVVRGRGGPGDEHELFDERWAWEQELGRDGWIGLSWPAAYGGREASLVEQVVFYEEYARAGGPGRVGIVGEGLLGPTLVHFGDDDQCRRFLPGILAGTEIWCQGYSEPDAGSDLANVQTRAELVGDEWVVHGQKVWTSLAHWAHWCFVLCRTDRDAAKHAGLSYLLVPMDQPGIEIRPIEQITGTSEFNETFFDGARTHVDNVVGGANNGWKVAMGTLAFERGASTLGQQLAFENELRDVTTVARSNGLAADPVFRQRLADAWITLRIMRYHALRCLPILEHGGVTRATAIHKLLWAGFHRALGELAVDALGAAGAIGGTDPTPGEYDLGALQRLFLYSRADTIYGGSNQIQRNVIGEQALGLPREPKVTR
ncbi:MAG TPA: acyl-CoA dehydrogenase family protein [Acidimicrobiia bacterium]|nr:acyl-CoA dehydrogenase family protein [Acidimicrobiia bacterium]